MPEQTTQEPSKQENIDLLIIKQSPQINLKKIAYERRLQILNNIVKVLGLAGAKKRIKELAKIYKISERQIYFDFDWIKGNFALSDLRAIKIDLKVARDRALEEALNLLSDSHNPDDKAKAIMILMDTAKRYREEQEAWGEKEKIAEKHEIISKNISLEIVCHDGKVTGSEADNKDKDGIKPEAKRGLGHPAG